MELDRRTVLGLGLGVVGAAAAGCAPLVHRFAGRKLPEDITVPKGKEGTAKVLDRLAFGPLPGEVREVSSRSYYAWLDAQLNPGTEDQALVFLQSRLDVHRLNAAELRDLPEALVLRQLRQSATLSAVYSPWQLRERMVDFWGNHFNIFTPKNWGTFRKGPDQLNVIRKHSLGNFRDLIGASAHSAAMLGYLDNYLNEQSHPNENYARELMELHTLGVHGGYTQKDVQEVARAFTGWGIENRFLRPRETFFFDKSRHDDGPKTVMGTAISPGKAGGDQIIDMLATHPNTAKYICGKLGRYFLGSETAPTVREAETAFLRTKGDLKATLRALLTEQAVTAGPPVVKRPFDYVVSSLRACSADTDGGDGLHRHLEAMGQPLFNWPMPDGYPDRTSAWTGSLLARWNFAWALAQGAVPGTSVDLKRVSVLFPDAASLTLALTDPDFSWR
jgi:uncharacterized protein (DUF1800 family)